MFWPGGIQEHYSTTVLQMQLAVNKQQQATTTRTPTTTTTTTRRANAYHAGVQHDRARLIGRVGVVVVVNDARDSAAVRGDVAVEAPLAARLVGQHLRVRARGNAVHGVVRAHDAARLADLDTGLKRGQVRVRRVLVGDNGVEVVAVHAVPVLCVRTAQRDGGTGTTPSTNTGA